MQDKKDGLILSNFPDKTLPLLDNKLKTIIMGIGDNLRAVRNKNNISQQEIADFLGVDRKTYVSWEMGTADIKSSYIPKLAEFLHVEINDLFRERSNEIVINQHNADNKDNSINGVIFLLTDKDSVNQLVEVMKEKLGNKG
jgi:transcriptional regulator with XRE-family HTH domain